MKAYRLADRKSISAISLAILSIGFSLAICANPKDRSNTYHTAKAYVIGEKTFDHVEIIIDTQKALIIKGCNHCRQETYTYQEEVSKIIGKNIFRLNTTDYIIEEDDGLLIWTKFSQGLDKKTWSRLTPYNVFAKERGYVRQLYTSAEMQNNIKRALITYSRTVKKSFAKSERITMR